jgi:CRISPR-associated protein Csm4
MAVFPVYRLVFRSPLHVGERGVGLEAAHTHVPADTLFSAICSVWRDVYGVADLLGDVLDWFDETDSEPFFLTSALPFAGPVRFFPKPLARLPHLTLGQDGEKTFKRVRFVSQAVFEALVTGQALTFDAAHCINDRTAWVTETEKQQMADWWDDETDDLVVWKKAVVPRVTLDRVTSASELWHFGETRFAAGAGLWFAAAFNAEHGDELQRRFMACLRVLGDTGLGGERGAGRGLFDVDEPQAQSLPEADPAERFVTLAPFCPRTEDELAQVTGDGAAYDLLPRRGWVTSPEAANLRRKMV